MGATRDDRCNVVDMTERRRQDRELEAMLALRAAIDERIATHSRKDRR